MIVLQSQGQDAATALNMLVGPFVSESEVLLAGIRSEGRTLVGIFLATVCSHLPIIDNFKFN